MAETILRKFDTAEEAVKALKALRKRGVVNESIALMSCEPIEIDHAEKSKPSRIGLFSIAGSLLGAAAALTLTVTTSRNIGLVTGGMPVVTPWAFGIIVFELTALGAILAALGRMIIEARLARPGALTNYDAEVSDGKVLMSVQCRDEAECEAVKAVLSTK